MRSKVVSALLVCLAPAVHAACGSQTYQRDEAPVYRPGQHVSGVIRVWGSPQMRELLHSYEESFHELQPDVRFEESLFSTITAVSGVYTGRADIGLLGREIWPTEIEAFRSVLGRRPTVIDLATGSLDVPKATFALMVFVPKGNPIGSLSTVQLEKIFGHRPGTPLVQQWGQLGLRGSLAHRPIHLYGFSPDNDKARIFSDLIFSKGEVWNQELHSFSNASGEAGVDAGRLIVEAVEADPYAIGISNIHYATPGVREVPLTSPEHALPVTATSETVRARTYPLTRAVSMVIDVAPEHPLSPVETEFVCFVLSRQGQEAVQKEGNYLPLPVRLANSETNRFCHGSVSPSEP